MKPLYLSIKGLQSFQEKQEINFEKIGRDGLFGIFGPTGSGKSTIIDGMTLALYGNIIRFKNNKDTGTKDFFDIEAVNKNSDEANVNFKFKVGENIYRVERNYKIGKKSGKLKKEAVLFKIENDQEIKLAENYKDIYTEIKENILGLTLEDFTRSVVLPQGNFSQFLKLGGTEKRDMLERIFNLEKYGDILSKKANSYKYSLENRLKELDIELSAIGFNEEELNSKTEELAKLEAELEELKIKNKKISAELLEMEETEKLELKLTEFINQKNELDSQAEYIEKLETTKNMAEKFIPVIEKIHKRNEYEENLKILVEDIKSDKEKFEQGKSMLDDIKKQFEILEQEETLKESEKKDNYIPQEEFLKASDNYNLALKKKTLTEKIERTEDSLKIIKFENERIKKELVEEQNKLQNLKGKLEKFENNTQEDIFNLKNDILEKNRVLEDLEKKEKEYLKVCEEKDIFLEKIKKHKETLSELEEREKIYLADREIFFISEIRKTLHKGDTCPICSGIYKEHVEDLKNKNSHFNEEKFEILQKDIRQENTNLQIAEEKYKTICESEIILKETLDIFPDIKIELKKLEEKKELLTKKYENEKQEKSELEKEIKTISDTVSRLEIKTAKAESEISMRNNSLDELKNELKEIPENSFSADELKEKLDILKEKNEIYNTLEIKLKNIRLEKKNISEKIEDWTRRTKVFETKLIQKEENHKNIKTDYLKLSDEINKILLENKISDLQHINSIEQSIDKIDSMKEEVEKYKNKKIYTLNMILDYQTQLKDRSFSKEKYHNLAECGRIVNMSLEKNIQAIGEVNKSIEIFNSNKQRAEEILKVKNKVELELNPAREMAELLKGRKFLDFLSAGKLQSITRTASNTLQKITNGRYKINVDEKSDFSIMDNFNSAVRKPQSLSGGETFMVSLCLALALADQIQLRGKSRLEFFFLDEGFGTLDSDLLEIVFSVLENLKAEGMTVGIITHVEEIKNRVARKLMVFPAQVGISGSIVKEI